MFRLQIISLSDSIKSNGCDGQPSKHMETQTWLMSIMQQT